ncbi:hypothetical protein LCGC14_1016010 [marine sediment metagenome]|uniref:Uncharacterized protein n=1 Tax=marine sediment metagenome TaxID=412755 RepID=A0A0F9NKE9_9ZZZZ
MKRFKVTEVVRQACEFEVSAMSANEAIDNVKRGIFNTAREQDSKRRVYSYPVDATYKAREIRD